MLAGRQVLSDGVHRLTQHVRSCPRFLPVETVVFG